MSNITKGLIALSALSFILAIIVQLFAGGSLAGVNAEGFSRACSNLALLAIALTLACPEKTQASGGGAG